MNHSRFYAFTLVELSVVLVIIGILAGGVIAGQALLQAATIRSAVSDIAKYNTATAAFYSKYGGLPGDLNVARAIEFHFSNAGDANATGQAGFRDGNGAIEGGGSGSTRLAGETALFWQDLGTSGFIGGSYTAIGTGTVGANITEGTMGTYLPATRFRENMSHFMYSDNGRNYYYLATFTSDGSAQMAPAPAMTPLEALGMDEKMDDGFPTTGLVVTMRNFTTPDMGAQPAITQCAINTVSPIVYNVSPDDNGAAEYQVCQLRIQSTF